MAGEAADTLRTGEFSYKAHYADIVVVGAGLAGITAANTAFENGMSVTVIDKSIVGHSGNTGLNWGHSFVTAEMSTDDGLAAARFLALDTMGIVDQDLAWEVVRTQIAYHPKQQIEQSGNILQRDDDGNVVGFSDENKIASIPDAHFTGAAQLLRQRAVPIFERMMLLDVLLDAEGTVSAIAALCLRSGSAHVFFGKRIILATGGYHWAKGVSAGSPESTGDAHAALLRLGLPFRDMEFPQYDFTGTRPFGSRPDKEKDMYEIAFSLAGNGESFYRFRDRSRKPLSFMDPHDRDRASIDVFQTTLIAAAKKLFERKGTRGDGSGNGLLFDLIDIMGDRSTLSYPTYKGFIRDVEHNMDFEFPDYYEVIANEYSSCGTPWVDPSTAETAIPGLYAVFTGLSAMSTTFAWSMAVSASHHAACTAESAGFGAIDPDRLHDVLASTYRLLDASPEKAIRSTEVFRSVQRCFYKGFGFIKSEEPMREALAELRRIEEEDLPLMYCADTSKRLNRDWRLALESRNILTCSIASIIAGIERKESRSPFFRADYPKMDNDGFLCCLWTSLTKDGKWCVSKGEIVDTVMSVEEMKEKLGSIDISEP